MAGVPFRHQGNPRKPIPFRCSIRLTDLFLVGGRFLVPSTVHFSAHLPGHVRSLSAGLWCRRTRGVCCSGLCVSKTSSVLIAWQNHITSARMVALISFLLNGVASLFKSKSRLEAENAALRHQLIVLQRKVRGRVPFTNSDRLFFVQLYRWFPSVLKAVTIIRPETLVRWHRAAFAAIGAGNRARRKAGPKSMRICGR
jgi:hypothetical protein